jgi:hypothetical protein
MQLQPYDFTCLAAAKRLFPHAHIDPASVEGPYCAIRKCQPHVRPSQNDAAKNLQLKLFADMMEAEEWARECPCGSVSPQDHFVRVVESLEPPESAAFRGREDWTHHRAAELLQKWAFITERLARGPATEAELNILLAAAEASGKAGWLSGDPLADSSNCLPTLQWAHSHKMVKAQYCADLTTIEFTL